MITRPGTRSILVAALVIVLALAPSALAGKGGKGKPGSSTSSTSTLSLKMVYDRNADGAPNWNDQVTFNVSTTAAFMIVLGSRD